MKLKIYEDKRNNVVYVILVAVELTITQKYEDGLLVFSKNNQI